MIIRTVTQRYVEEEPYMYGAVLEYPVLQTVMECYEAWSTPS